MKLAPDTNIKGDIGGVISITLTPGKALNDFCTANIDNYDPDRFEIIAIRAFYGKETSVTVYAKDNVRTEGSNFSKDKIPVKKFKLNAGFLKNLVPVIQECNFTLTTGNYRLEDMEVINK